MLVRLLDRLAGSLGALFLRALGSTWRIEHHGGASPLDGEAPVLGLIWHAGLFCAGHRFRDRGIAIAVSRSRDGDRVDAVLRALGFGPSPRGSSSRGGVGLLTGLIRSAREGRSLGILGDGPRGPARRLKPGVVLTARATGLPLHAIGVAARPALRFPSWDRAFLPLPFARVVFEHAPPLELPRRDPRDTESWRAELEGSLARVQERAESRLA